MSHQDIRFEWYCNSGSFYKDPKFLPKELEEIDDCETLLVISQGRGYPILNNWRARICEIRRAGLLRHDPDAFHVFDDRLMPAMYAYFPEFMWLTRYEKVLPFGIREHRKAIESYFGDLFVMENANKDYVLFAKEGWQRDDRCILLVGWSENHDPPSLAKICDASKAKQSRWQRLKSLLSQ